MLNRHGNGVSAKNSFLETLYGWKFFTFFEKIPMNSDIIMIENWS